ncbi:DMT family transporter [Bacillus alkalicellulosilyticus]|uniref:DMT family transporter n=1 Tax=Alkalihalobacterium alkalicellulosilyticum TaxID=1912214 RepID=UPI000998AB64|nr:DMT family transporter [Bacillus alkalicellulosilyticus]
MSSFTNKNNAKNTYLIGTIFLLGSAVLTSITQVLNANKVQAFSPFAFTFISFLFTALFFIIVSIKKKGNTRKLDSASKKDYLYLNLYTALAFMCFFYALKYVEPAIVSAIEIGIGPVFALLLAKAAAPGMKTLKSDSTVAWGTLASSLLLVWATLTGRSGLHFVLSGEFILGLSASLLCGVGAVLAAQYSKKLSMKGWESSHILAHRFYFIIIASLCLAILEGHLISQLSTHFLWIVLLSFLGVLLPLYMLQVGIKYCDTFFVMVTIAFVPIFTFIFQLLDPRIGWSTTTLIGILNLTLFALLGVYLKNRRLMDTSNIT